MISASDPGGAPLAGAASATTTATAISVRAATPASRRLAIAAGGGLARRVDLRVRAVVQHLAIRLHRRIGEMLAAVARHDRAGRQEHAQRDRPEQHGRILTPELACDDPRSRSISREADAP